MRLIIEILSRKRLEDINTTEVTLDHGPLVLSIVHFRDFSNWIICIKFKKHVSFVRVCFISNSYYIRSTKPPYGFICVSS